MSENDHKTFDSGAQVLAEILSIGAEGRLHDDPTRKAQAFVDVTLYLRPGGSIAVHGCAVLQEDGKEPAVLLPGRKGERRYFPIVSLSGEIRRIVEQTVLKEYERLRSAAE
jgi:hypothetical protein